MIKNTVYLWGPVIKTGMKTHKNGVEEVVCVMGAIRGYRHIGDGRENVKIDRPVIQSRDEKMRETIITWRKNDIVFIKGAVATRTENKGATCPFCGCRNETEGLTVYIEPIFIQKLFTAKDDSESLKYLNSIREISNQVYIAGNLTRDPKKIKVKNGPTVTQYPLAVKRNYTIKEDPPSLDVDFPWVKVYGQNAYTDRERLKLGSTVDIDGIIQTRSINRKLICAECNQRYEYKERTLEIVPYETDYVRNYYTEEEAAANEKARKEQILKSRGLDKFNLKASISDYDDDDEITDDDVSAGFDTMEE